MKFKEVMRWMTDDAPETTPVIIVVSETGVVKRLSHKMWNKKNNGYSVRKELICTQSNNRGKQRYESGNNKYMHVNIKDGAFFVHRLVALAWIPNPQNKSHVNHKNGIKNDNRVENLEWVTNLENRRHAISIGLPRKSIEKISNKQVDEMKIMRLAGKNLKDIGKIFNVTGECVRYRTKKIMTPYERALVRQKNNRWKNHNE